MASHDVRDVLNLPTADPSAGPRPAKKQKTSAARSNLKGLAREIQNLSGDSPLSIVPAVSVFKKRRLASRKPAARWEMRAFKNPARGDDGALVLRHWRRKVEGENRTDAADASQDRMDVENGDPQDAGADRTETAQPASEEPIEESAFAKFNVKVIVPEYSDDQYQSNLQHDEWTKGETDYLLRLVKEYDLRWPLIWDRYDYMPPGPDGETVDGDSTAIVPVPKPRTMEDLKARYYSVAAKMMSIQKPPQYMTEAEFSLHEIMTKFNATQEKLRKEFAVNSMARSKDEAREEESLLLEIKRILARTERFNEERHELYRRLDYPHADQDISAFKSSAGLQTLLQNLMNVDKVKKRKSLMGAEGISPGSAQPGSAPADGTPVNRRESIAAVGGGHRESLGGSATPVTAEAGPSTTASNKKKGGTATAERRKLTEQEEQVYGVSQHERLAPSGPTFRYEKINKLYSRWSGQQQLRMTNALSELDVPARLVMPTASVTAQFEVLWNKVVALVDARKVADKLDAEIKLEEAKKAEREKGRAAPGGQREGATGGPPPAKPESGADGDAAEGAGADRPAESTPAAVDGAADGASAQADPKGDDLPQDKQPNGDSVAETAPDAESQALPSEPAVDGDKVPAPAAQPHVAVKEEEVEKERSIRPGSSGAHKRSASVLSTTSDRSAKSAKRQKK